MAAPVVARAAFPMARGLMNLLRDPKKIGRKIWDKGTPDKPGISYLDQLKGGVRQSRAKTVPHGGTPPGALNRFGRNHPYLAEAGIYAGGGLAGLTAVDRIASMMRDDEVAPDVSAIGGGISPSMPMPAKLDFESRQAFEARKSKKMNKQMKRLLQYYGIVNLVNPDSASDMLKLGTAMLEQEIGQMGTDRQAKIFDAIFKDGSMPASGAEAARMILNAGGTAEDVADITDIYESITPKAPDLAEDERGVLDLQQARSLVSAGYDNEAVNLIEDSIRAGRLENEQQAGMNLPPREQAKMMVQAMGGAASGGLDSSLLNIEPE